MAHNIIEAINNLKKSIEGLSWSPKVKFEEQDKGAANLVTIVPAALVEEFRFGEVKRIHSLNIKAYFSAKDTTPQTVQSRCAEINNCMILDRKRGGNALTTVTATWTDDINDGRQLVIMTSEPQIQVLETC